MKTPYLIHFIAISTDEHINVKASVSTKKLSLLQSFPIHSITFKRKVYFEIEIICYNKSNDIVLIKEYESDPFGSFKFKIPTSSKMDQIYKIEIFEISNRKKGITFLGSCMPIKASQNLKLVISDFDKTLVDTKYSSIKEIYKSLTTPLHHFPTIEKCVTRLKMHINNNYYPFILSASPHFYENAIRDWLKKNDINTAGIFLKDYRQMLSIFNGLLSPIDIKYQGTYKLTSLLDIILMTGIPEEIVLMGDDNEADPIIYAIFMSILKGDRGPWNSVLEIKKNKFFKITNRQTTSLLNRFHLIESLVKSNKEKVKSLKYEIIIRKITGKNFYSEKNKVSNKYLEQIKYL